MPGATLFERVTVVDHGGPLDGQRVDLLVDEEGLMHVGARDRPSAGHVRLDGLHVSPGWVDIGAGVGEPGHEQRETVRSLQAAAVEGGYTRVLAQPITDPVVDDAAAAEAFAAKAAGHPVRVTPIGALSRDGAGDHLAEFADMAQAGVSFVGEGLGPVDDPKLLQLALAYARPLDITVSAQPGQRRLSDGALVHEGRVSTLLGVPGFPAMAEAIGLARDLELLGYRGGRLLVIAPSLAASVDLLLAARAGDSEVQFGVSALHLLLCDEDALGYDRGAKVLPPLRATADRERLRAAIASGEADALLSLHRPLTAEETNVEFARGAFGAATLERAFGIAARGLGDALAVARYLSTRNRACARVDPAHLRHGAPAELTFFLPERRYEAPARSTASLAANPALPLQTLRGLPVGICVGGDYLPSRFAAALLTENP